MTDHPSPLSRRHWRRKRTEAASHRRLMPVLLIGALLAGPGAAADWPHWRGLARNGTSPESSGWDEGARLPDRELWRGEFGEGATSPLVVGGTLYTLGWRDHQDTVYAVDAATGAVRWKQSYPCPPYGRHATGDQMFYRGVSATPEYDPSTGLLYTLSIDGDLHCWNTKASGKKVWSLNLCDRYAIPRRPKVTRSGQRDYGTCSAPMVHGDWLLVEAGAPAHGNLIALNKRTGKEVWISANKDPAGHTGGLAPLTVEGVPCVAVLTARHLVVTRLDPPNAGGEVASVPWTTDYINNIATPTADGNRVIVTSHYNMQSTAMFEINLNEGAHEIWRVQDASGVCTPVVFEGHLYWANRGLFCLDLATGRRLWQGGNYRDAGSCIATADGRLLLWANDGDLSIAETARRSPDKVRVLQERQGVFHGRAWPHIVFADGRLYVRDIGGAMKCFALRPQESKH